MTHSEFIIRPAGEGGMIIGFGQEMGPALSRRVHGMAGRLRQKKINGIYDIVPAYCSITIYFNPLDLPYKELEQAVTAVLKGDDGSYIFPKSRLLVVPVCYGGVLGPDLEYVARNTGFTVEEVIELHTQKLYLVYMLGFTPGFAYLGGLPNSLVLPRQNEPRLRVPAGSVGIGGSQTGFYSVESQGEWWLIGRTPLQSFSAQETPPFLLQPGDYVKFSAIEQGEFFSLRRQIREGKYRPQICEFEEAGV